MLFSVASLALLAPTLALSASSASCNKTEALSTGRGHRKFFGHHGHHGPHNGTRNSTHWTWSSRWSGSSRERAADPTDDFSSFAESSSATVSLPTGGNKAVQTAYETSWATTYTTEFVGARKTVASSSSSSTKRRTRTRSSTSSAKVTTTSKAPATTRTTTRKTSTTTKPASVTTTRASATTKTSTTASKTTSSASSSTTAAAGSVESIALKAHNDLRAKHSAPDLTWSTELAESAATWANKCIFKHGGGDALNAGENLAVYSGAQDTAMAIGLWTSEESAYDYSNPVFSSATGHFSQVVWKSTTQLGCADVSCVPTYDEDGSVIYKTNGRMLVCHYLAAGNYVGQFADNVLES
ncbi:hypothetical protein JCM8547_004943 [Rhodosporidiobolus lusitaniae]